MKKILLTLAISFSSVAALSSCAPKAVIARDAITLTIDQSHQTIKAGEAVTYTALATGVTGRNEKIAWKEHGGDLTLLAEQRYARVVYEKPGIYTIEASMTVEGQDAAKSMATVVVEPLE